MMPLVNEYTEHLDDEMTQCSLEGYKPYYSDQIVAARDKLCGDICKVTGTTEYDHLQYVSLHKNKITKDMLCVWLESAICILNSYCSPVLEDVKYKIEELQSEKLTNQQKIIDLQDKLIVKKDEELANVQKTVQSTVQSTVQCELKSYSSALTNTCSKALAPNRMKAALKSVAEEEDRSRNMIIYGLKEQKGENLEERVLEVLEHLDEKPRLVSFCRMGKAVADGGPTVKPIKFTLAGRDHVRQILAKSRKLKEVEGYSAVYVCPDRTAENRMAYRKLVEELKIKQSNDQTKTYIIKNNKIVSSEKG